jgi:hypothetical protein
MATNVSSQGAKEQRFIYCVERFSLKDFRDDFVFQPRESTTGRFCHELSCSGRYVHTYSVIPIFGLPVGVSLDP